MASLVPKRIVDICYDAKDEGYDLCVRRQAGGETTYLELGLLTRQRMLEYVLDLLVQELNDENLSVRVYATKYPTEDTRPRVLTKKFVSMIVQGLVKVSDLRLGKLTTFLDEQLRRSVSPLVPIRYIPGTPNHIECVFCGRAIALGKCSSCQRTVRVIKDTLRGWCVDLLEAAQTYPDVDRFFVNQPWNPNPPWISRQDLTHLLNKEN